MNKHIRFTSTFDSSGYGKASRDTAICLINSGINVSVQVINTSMSRREFSIDNDQVVINRHINNKKANINIVQLIPNLWHLGFDKDTYNIGYFFIESDRICDDWINIINNGLCNEVWVTCQSNYNALMTSGIKKPVYLIPQCCRVNKIDADIGSKVLPLPNNSSYKFYSIFQWSQRKNPETLLRAYFNEFSNEDNVMLILKTYGPSSFSDKRNIKESILNIKAHTESSALVYFIGDLLTIEQTNAIHPQCNCYVSTSSGEGWNIPLTESMVYGKQIISARSGGIIDFVNDEDIYLIPSKQININTDGNIWGHYYKSDPPQKWCDINVVDVQNAMRMAYSEKNNYEYRIKKYNKILNNCSEYNVSEIIKQRLSRIL